MRSSRFNEEQIIGVIKERELGCRLPRFAASMASVQRRFISTRRSLAGMEVSDVRKLKALEDESAKLKNPL